MAKFLIDSDEATPQPNNMRHAPRPEVGTTLSGKPVKQGYKSLEVVYAILGYAEMAKLLSFYDPADPAVTVTFDEPETGGRVRYNAYMHEPMIGARETLYYREVTVAFTHLTGRTPL